jgi:hypothetical protein
MSAALEIHEVDDGLWVGACPATPEFIRALRLSHDIGGIVSVQTDDDLDAMGLSWPFLWRFLMSQGMAIERVPVVDFNDADLALHLDAAVAAVAAMRDAGHNTYLHCTAGINRSPTVAIAYLVARRGMDLDEAWQQVVSRRATR